MAGASHLKHGLGTLEEPRNSWVVAPRGRFLPCCSGISAVTPETCLGPAEMSLPGANALLLCALQQFLSRGRAPRVHGLHVPLIYGTVESPHGMLKEGGFICGLWLLCPGGCVTAAESDREGLRLHPETHSQKFSVVPDALQGGNRLFARELLKLGRCLQAAAPLEGWQLSSSRPALNTARLRCNPIKIIEYFQGKESLIPCPCTQQKT